MERLGLVRSLMLLLVMLPVLNLVVFRTLQMMLLIMPMRLMGHQNHQHHNNIRSNVLKTTKFIFSNKRTGSITRSNISDRTILNREPFESPHLTLACKNWHAVDSQLVPNWFPN